MSYKFLDNLERRLGRYAVPHLTEAIVVAHALFYVGIMTSQTPQEFVDSLVLRGRLVTEAGEWWRLVSFIFIPPLTHPIFAFFALYLFLLYGRALDQEWGTLKYNLYLLIAYLATAALAFVFPDKVLTNAYIGLTVFLAFAVLYPDFQLLLFFVLPVKIKWLAWIAWALLIYQFVRGDTATKFMIQASVLNFMLFFGKDIAARVRGIRRGAQRRSELRRAAVEPFHRCAVCGKTDKSDPSEEFRYCPDCEGAPGYCSSHIFNHEHIKPPAVPTAAPTPAKPRKEKW